MALFTTGYRPLTANRWEPFEEVISFEDYNFTSATFIGQVRLTRDASGAALATLSFTAPSVATVDGVTISTVTMSLTEAAMEALPLPDELGDDVTLWWDMQITPSGGTKFRALEGEFIVHAGVTH